MMLHLLRILALIFRSKFQLIQDGCFLKVYSTIYNFVRNRESQISTLSMPKMCFKLLLKIVTSFEPFFEFFTWCICFFIQFIFQKIYFLKQRGRISLLDRLEQIYCGSHLKFWEKIEHNAEFVLSSASVSYFGHNFLLKIPIDSEFMFFERKFNFL